MMDHVIRILLVDDDEEEYFITKKLLKNVPGGKYELTWKPNYQEGLAAVETEEFDTALIDYRLDAKFGTSLLEALKEKKCRTPLIMLTGKGDERIAVEAMKLGAVDYISKTQLTSELLDTSIRHAIEAGVMKRQLEDYRNQLEVMAREDELTGLCNRREIMSVYEREFIRAKRYQNFFSIIMLDLDHFKKVNDTYGHATGDDVLRQAGQIIKGILRDTDAAGRYGGEEFLIVLPSTPLDGALIVGERLRAQMEEVVHVNGTHQFTVTCSIGITEAALHDKLASVVLERADSALYQSKEDGRNRVTCL